MFLPVSWRGKYSPWIVALWIITSFNLEEKQSVQRISFLYCRRHKLCEVYLGHKTCIDNPSTHQFQTLVERACSYTFTFLKTFSYTFTFSEKKQQYSYFKTMFSPLQWSTEVSSAASHVCIDPTRSSWFLNFFQFKNQNIYLFFSLTAVWSLIGVSVVPF